MFFFWHGPSLSSGSLLCLQPVDSSWRGQGQTCPLCLNKSYFKCSPLQVFCFFGQRPFFGLKPPVSLWQVQWLRGCGSRLNTWSRIPSGTWWLGTGAAYLRVWLAATEAGREREGGRGRKGSRRWVGGSGSGEGLTEEQLKGAADKKKKREEKEGRVWAGRHSWQADERKEAKVRFKWSDVKKRRKKWGVKKRWNKVKWMSEGEMWEAETRRKTYGWMGMQQWRKRRTCPSLKRKRKISRSDGGDGDMLMHTRWQRWSSADWGADKRGGGKKRCWWVSFGCCEWKEGWKARGWCEVRLTTYACRNPRYEADKAEMQIDAVGEANALAPLSLLAASWQIYGYKVKNTGTDFKTSCWDRKGVTTEKSLSHYNSFIRFIASIETLLEEINGFCFLQRWWGLVGLGVNVHKLHRWPLKLDHMTLLWRLAFPPPSLPPSFSSFL